MNAARWLIGSFALLGTTGCLYGPKTIEYQEVRAKYEEEFANRELDPIEGFWQSKNQYGEGIGVVYNTDPAGNQGFPYAARPVREVRKVALPHPYCGNRVGGRWKPSTEPGVYHGEILMSRGQHTFWADATLKLLDPTTAEVTVHVDGPVLGGRTQRGYYVGPEKEMEARLAATEEGRQQRPSGPRAVSASGFLISRSLVVTNYHVVKDAQSIRCSTKEQTHNARLLAHDQNNDLALLELEEPVPFTVTCFRIGDSSSVRHGQTVYAMGYPLTTVLGSGLRVHQGIVSSLTGSRGSSSEFQVEMSVNPGDSGGPLLDGSGSVVGVVTSKLGLGVVVETGSIPEGVAFVVKADMAKSLLAAAGRVDEVDYAPGDETTTALENLATTLGGAVVRVQATGQDG